MMKKIFSCFCSLIKAKSFYFNEFARAVEMEKQEGGKGYTWIQGMTLEELVERKDEILANSKKRKEQLAKKKDNRSWQDI
jgi:hypothetical protein